MSKRSNHNVIRFDVFKVRKQMCDVIILDNDIHVQQICQTTVYIYIYVYLNATRVLSMSHCHYYYI